MGASAGPDIVDTGLVLALDAADFNSFKGSSATNLLYSITNTYGTIDGTTFKTSYGDIVENIPSLGYKTVRYCNIWNDYPNSGNCCPSPFRYGGSVIGQNITVSPSTTYTYQIIYKTKSGYTHPNFMYRYEYGNSGYVTESGVHNDSNRTSLGNDWWFAWGQFTTQSTTTYLWLTGMWYYQYNVYETIYLAGVSLHQGTNIIPARYMLTPQENRGTTVATGGGWADLTGRGNHGELVNGVRESSVNGGSLSFDGTNQYIEGSISSSIFTGPHSISCWFYRETVTDWSGLFSNNVNTTSCSIFTFISTTNSLGTNQAGVNGTSIAIDLGANHLNKWIYAVITYAGVSSGSAVNVYAYKDGSLLTASGSLYWNMSSSSSYYIGRHWTSAMQVHDGFISNLQVYNRALSAAEVSQNFNMMRSRFGI